MADSGVNWGAAAHLTYSTGTDIDGIAVADAGTLTSDELSQDVKAVTYISVVSYEDNTGAPDGNVDVYILGPDADPDGETYQSATDDAPWQTVIDQSQNTTHRVTFAVPGYAYPKLKVYVENNCGQEVAITINYYQGTWPAAS